MYWYGIVALWHVRYSLLYSIAIWYWRLETFWSLIFCYGLLESGLSWRLFRIVYVWMDAFCTQVFIWFVVIRLIFLWGFFPMLLVHFPNRMDFCYARPWATADLELRWSVGERRNPLRLPLHLESFLIYFYDKKLACTYIAYKVLMKSKAENAVQTRVVLLWLESNWQLWCHFWDNQNIADIRIYETNMSKIRGT